MNDLDLIQMHDNIITLQAAVTDLVHRVNLIQNGEMKAQARFNAEELTSLSNIANSNSVEIDDLRNDINGVNQELQTLTGVVHGLDHRVRFS